MIHNSPHDKFPRIIIPKIPWYTVLPDDFPSLGQLFKRLKHRENSAFKSERELLHMYEILIFDMMFFLSVLKICL